MINRDYTKKSVSGPLSNLSKAQQTIWIALLALLTAFYFYSSISYSSATFDEPFHLASGMQWHNEHNYTYDRIHPPLGRVMIALGPWLKGLRPGHGKDAMQDGTTILRADGKFQQNLMLARLGNAPFLILAATIVFLWAKRWFHATTNLWALTLFLSLPPILAHASLATIDMAQAASLVAALYTWLLWLDSPTHKRSALLGLAIGIAFLCKLSNIFFFLACASISLPFLFRKRHCKLPAALYIVSTMLFVLWAGYGFSSQPYPLRQFALGIKDILLLNSTGHDSFLLGQYSKEGWWYFFPVVLAVKTPLVLLTFSLLGSLLMLDQLRQANPHRLLTFLFPLTILLLSIVSSINLGVRHILAVYPFAAILAAAAIHRLLDSKLNPYPLLTAPILLFSILLPTWQANPQLLAYFNPIAGSEPGLVLAESDLDWGQDLNALQHRLKQRGIKQISVKYFGGQSLEDAGLVNTGPLHPHTKTTGYIAISARFLYLAHARSGDYDWLKIYTPLERIGQSIFLYRIDK
jgi:hypothetical protein